MSLIEDDSINGSIIESKEVDDFKPKLSNNLRSRLIEYGINHKKFTKDDLYIDVSSSGVATVIVKALIQKGIFVEHTFECNTCKWYSVDETKINID